MKPVKSVFLLALVTLLLGGCANMETSNITSTDLQHHHWKLSAIDGVAVAEDSKSDLEIGEHMSIHGLAGCNRFFGTATLEHGVLKAGSLGSTLMACPPDQRKVEEAVLGTLTRGATVKHQKQTMQLIGEEHTLTYELSDFM